MPEPTAMTILNVCLSIILRASAARSQYTRMPSALHSLETVAFAFELVVMGLFGRKAASLKIIDESGYESRD